MKVIGILFLLTGIMACQTKEAPTPAINPTDFVGAYQFRGTITHSEATEGYLQSPRIQSVVEVSGQLQITTFGTGTAIQINETSINGEVNMRYQASPATKQMVPIYVADKSVPYADLDGSIYLINEKEISLSRTITNKSGNTYYTQVVALRGVRI